VIFLALSALCASAVDQKQSPAAQPDPVMNALSHGVDHLDGVNPANSDALQRHGARYEVENGDVLDLQFEFTPELSDDLKIIEIPQSNLIEVSYRSSHPEQTERVLSDLDRL